MIDGQEIYKCCESCKYYCADYNYVEDQIYFKCNNENSDNYKRYTAASDCCIEWECGFYDD